MNGDNRAQAVASGGGAMPQPGSDEWLKVASREELVQLIRILQLKLTQKTSKPKYAGPLPAPLASTWPSFSAPLLSPAAGAGHRLQARRPAPVLRHRPPRRRQPQFLLQSRAS
jgi:hypothetical protein